MSPDARRRWAQALLIVIGSIVASDFALSANAAPTARRALIIGNANYTAVEPLKNPVHDAQDICQLVQAMGFVASCYYDLKTRAQMRAAIQDFTQTLTPNTVSLIFYAGHGVQIQGDNFLIPAEARLESGASVVRESVSMGYVMRQLRQTQTYLNLVILDACRNNPIHSQDGETVQGLAQISASDIPDSTVLFYATAANSLALDGNGHNGILTRNLLAHMRDQGTVTDLFDSVSSGVRHDAAQMGGNQIPALYKNFDGQYCLVRCTNVELLQQQQQESQERITTLEARIRAGDDSARTELAAAKAANAKLEREAANAQKARKDMSVPPAF